MPKKQFQFHVGAWKQATLEASDGGMYLRFKDGVKAAKTVVRSEWPHVAVDLDADNSVIGIEFVPPPQHLSLGAIAKQAGIELPARLSAANLKIATGRASSPALVSA